MRNTILKVIVTAFFGSILLLGCIKENEVRPDPTLTLYSGAGYIDKDTTVASGKTIPIGLNCKWNGVDRLLTLSIYLNNSLQGTYSLPDSVQEEGLLNIYLFKTNLDQDNWLFEITDANRQQSYHGLIVKKDKTGKAIKTFTNIILGAQSNSGIGGFFALSNSSAYNLTNATANQSLIDLVIAFDDVNKTYLASPSADLTNEYDLSAWTIKNTTLYCKTDLSVKQYDYVDSDILLISEFNSALQSEKAKELAVGNVYSFKSMNNKYGLIKINSVSTGVSGAINFDIKMQQ